MIHILGSVRTGSTYLYQLIVNHFHVNYFDNTGDIYTADKPVPYISNYGKTKGKHEPSEASRVWERYWGEQKTPLPDMEQRLKLFFGAAEPLVMKNVWNVYRIDEWVRLFPDTQFIWIRRDYMSAARSDMEARHRNGTGLNGAYLKHDIDISHLQGWEQVYLQQVNINKTIERGLHGKDFIQIWYYDLCSNLDWELARLKKFLRVEYRDDR